MELVSDQGSHFINKVVQSLTLTHVIIHRKSIVYCSQVNSFNKVDKQNLVEIIEENCEWVSDKLAHATAINLMGNSHNLQIKLKMLTISSGVWFGSNSTYGIHGTKLTHRNKRTIRWKGMCSSEERNTPPGWGAMIAKWAAKWGTISTKDGMGKLPSKKEGKRLHS